MSETSVTTFSITVLILCIFLYKFSLVFVLERDRIHTQCTERDGGDGDALTAYLSLKMSCDTFRDQDHIDKSEKFTSSLFG